MLLAAAALLVAEPMLASPSLVAAIWVQGWHQGLGAIWQQLVVGPTPTPNPDPDPGPTPTPTPAPTPNPNNPNPNQVGAAMLYPACVSGGLLLELFTSHLHRLEAPLRAVHKTRDCVACLFLFAPLFALGLRHATLHARARSRPHSRPSSSPPRHLTRGGARLPFPGVLRLPARAHKIAIFQQSFIDPPKHYIGWYVLFSGLVVALLAHAIF